MIQGSEMKCIVPQNFAIVYSKQLKKVILLKEAYKDKYFSEFTILDGMMNSNSLSAE